MKLHGRTLTPLLARCYRLAKRAHLSFPLGRAAYCVNVHYNGRLYGMSTRPYGEPLPDTTIMRKCRLTTAAVWQAHFVQGGSLKALRYKHEEWNHIRREQKRSGN